MEKFNVNVSPEKVKKYLMNRIDKSNPVEVEKVGRYIKHIEMYRKMDRTVTSDGVSITVINGSQQYVKSHPLLAEMNKVNASLLSIEKTFKFSEKEPEDEEVNLI